MNTLQTIREKVIAAVPEIVTKHRKKHWYYTNEHQDSQEWSWIEITKTRPITLADVLRAIFKSSPENCVYAIDEVGEFHAIVSTTSAGIGVYWNLSLNLDENIQENPELGEFLLKILV